MHRKISTVGNTKNRKISMGGETTWPNLTSGEGRSQNTLKNPGEMALKPRNNSATVNKLDRITCSKLVWESERDLKHEIPRMKETVEAHAKNAPESPSKKPIR